MGRIDFALTPDQKADARAALKMLDGTGISLTEAARRAFAGKRALKRVSVEECFDLFLRDRLRADLRKSTVEYYSNVISVFSAEFGDRSMDDVSRAELIEWIDARPGSASTRASYTRAIRAMWRWAIQTEPPLAGVDITQGLRSSAPRREGAGSKILPVAECEAIMQGAGRYRSALAVMLFAGVRPQEVASRYKPSLTWEHVNCTEHMIRIPAEISKTRKARIMEGMPPTLWAWLQPGALRDPICPARSREAVERAAEIAGYGKKRPWPVDALRHTFATYHLAAFADPGKTALLLGHEGNPTMLYQHYRGLATKADAEKFWKIMPGSDS